MDRPSVTPCHALVASPQQEFKGGSALPARRSIERHPTGVVGIAQGLEPSEALTILAVARLLDVERVRKHCEQ